MQRERFEVSSERDRAEGRRVVCWRDCRSWLVDATINHVRYKRSLRTRDRAEAMAKALEILNGRTLGAIETTAKLNEVPPSSSHDIDVSGAISEYLTHLSLDNSEAYVRVCGWVLRKFFGSVTVRTLSRLTAKHVLDEMTRRKIKDHASDKTLSNLRGTLYGLCQWAFRLKYVASNPIADIPPRRMSPS